MFWGGPQGGKIGSCCGAKRRENFGQMRKKRKKITSKDVFFVVLGDSTGIFHILMLNNKEECCGAKRRKKLDRMSARRAKNTHSCDFSSRFGGPSGIFAFFPNVFRKKGCCGAKRRENLELITTHWPPQSLDKWRPPNSLLLNLKTGIEEASSKLFRQMEASELLIVGAREKRIVEASSELFRQMEAFLLFMLVKEKNSN